MIKMIKAIHQKKNLRFQKINRKWQGISVYPMRKSKNLFILVLRHEQLNRGVSFAEDDESLDDQNISIAGHTFTDRPHYQFTNLKAAKRQQSLF